MNLPTEYQQYIHLSRYARWLEEKGRRETWEETVQRFIDFITIHLKEKYKSPITTKDLKRIHDAILNLEVMPSMRALMTAGQALDRDHIAGYNCAYIECNRLRAFDEILYILMCGTGVGFSVERQQVQKLPDVPGEMESTDTTIIVADSKVGWAKALRELVSLLYAGQIPKYDTSKLRPAGARLKIFGGRASGPKPLEDLFKFIIDKFVDVSKSGGRCFTSIECHDIICKIAESVVVGGVRRSALISLSNLSDDRMRHCKDGQWWELNSQRSLANNSAVYTERPEMSTFMKEWRALFDSKSGERGIFNRAAANKQVLKTERREIEGQSFGTNPCSEIILRDREFCNLTEVVIREKDTIDTLRDKIEVATILGTVQATLTDFKYITKEWQKNCEEERLLGVSLTGIMDHKHFNGSGDRVKLQKDLKELKIHSIDINKKLVKKFDINQSTSITCVKPSGTVSQLVDAASGIHTRHSKYYKRTVRSDKKDPLCKFMIDRGFPYEDEINKPEYVAVFSFPIKTPNNAITRKELSALEQLEIWKIYQDCWCEHKPSITVSVREYEWMAVGAWVYENFDSLSGISFLPYSEHSYRQAPYQECDEKEYKELLKQMPKDVDWKELDQYEGEDNTISSQEFACTGNACEVVDTVLDTN